MSDALGGQVKYLTRYTNKQKTHCIKRMGPLSLSHEKPFAIWVPLMMINEWCNQFIIHEHVWKWRPRVLHCGLKRRSYKWAWKYPILHFIITLHLRDISYTQDLHWKTIMDETTLQCNVVSHWLGAQNDPMQYDMSANLSVLKNAGLQYPQCVSNGDIAVSH